MPKRNPPYYDENASVYGKRTNEPFDFDFVKRDFDYDFMKRQFKPENFKRLSLFDYWTLLDYFFIICVASTWNWTFLYFPAI